MLLDIIPHNAANNFKKFKIILFQFSDIYMYLSMCLLISWIESIKLFIFVANKNIVNKNIYFF